MDRNESRMMSKIITKNKNVGFVKGMINKTFNGNLTMAPDGRTIYPGNMSFAGASKKKNYIRFGSKSEAEAFQKIWMQNKGTLSFAELSQDSGSGWQRYSIQVRVKQD